MFRFCAIISIAFCRRICAIFILWLVDGLNLIYIEKMLIRFSICVASIFFFFFFFFFFFDVRLHIKEIHYFHNYFNGNFMSAIFLTIQL